MENREELSCQRMDIYYIQKASYQNKSHGLMQPNYVL